MACVLAVAVAGAAAGAMALGGGSDQRSVTTDIERDYVVPVELPDGWTIVGRQGPLGPALTGSPPTFTVLAADDEPSALVAISVPAGSREGLLDMWGDDLPETTTVVDNDAWYLAPGRNPYGAAVLVVATDVGTVRFASRSFELEQLTSLAGDAISDVLAGNAIDINGFQAVYQGPDATQLQVTPDRVEVALDDPTGNRINVVVTPSATFEPAAVAWLLGEPATVVVNNTPVLLGMLADERVALTSVGGVAVLVTTARVDADLIAVVERLHPVDRAEWASLPIVPDQPHTTTTGG